MPARTLMEVHAALVAGNPSEVLGCSEGRDIDFKSAPYQLETPKGKWELAKDIAAFANLGGGLIVVGVRAKRLQNQLNEVADELRPVRKNLVDASKYRDAIANGISPSVEGIELSWFPDEVVAEDAILTIYVPCQPDRLKPFVLRRVVDESSSEVAAFAIPVRNEDRTEWMTADQVQSQLAMMAHFRRTGAFPVNSGAATRTELDARLIALVRSLNADSVPCLALQIYPPTPLDLTPGLYEEGGIVETLRRWKGIRPMGFDLGAASSPTLHGSDVWFGDQRWRARIGADGSFDLLLPVSFDFLCWAMNRSGGDAPLRINPVPLVEVTLDFFRLAESTVLRMSRTGGWTASLRSWRMKAGGVKLASGLQDVWRSANDASTDDFAWPPFTVTGRPEKDAFNTLVRIYGLWGLGADAIPFASDGEIVPDSIGALR